MKIQSLSIAVPAGCGNDCTFCVAHMHRASFINQIEENTRFFDLYEADYINRMAYARDNGCNSVMLTGDGEPLLNRHFLKFFTNCNRMLKQPFRQIELQTSGMTLDDTYLRFLRNTVGVSVISISLSAFDSEENAVYNRPRADRFFVHVAALCSEIKRYDFSLRLSLNLTDFFSNLEPVNFFATAKILGADQLTFRVLYESGKGSPEDRWIQEHRCRPETVSALRDFIKTTGRALNKLPFGATRFSVHDISVVMDEDCMSTEVGENLKYLILREDCKLYSHWDDKGSLIF